MKQRGFTLIELMVVIAILGTLATLVAVNMDRHQEDAMLVVAKADMHGLKQALASYKLDNGRYPAELGALYEGSTPYLENPPPLDPWGYEYMFEREGGRVAILSSFADGAPGGEGADADLDSRELLRRERRERRG